MGKLDFNAFYSTTNPSDANAFASGYQARATTAFGAGVTSLGYVLAGTNDASTIPTARPAWSCRASIATSIRNSIRTQVNLSASPRSSRPASAAHDLKLGLYGSLYGEDQPDDLPELSDRGGGQAAHARSVAYNAAGTRIGRVTDNGALQLCRDAEPSGDSDAQMFALFANDTWEIVPGLRIDAGIRHERYNYDGYALLTGAANLGDPTTLADDADARLHRRDHQQRLKPACDQLDGRRQLRLRHASRRLWRAVASRDAAQRRSDLISINPTIITHEGQPV